MASIWKTPVSMPQATPTEYVQLNHGYEVALRESVRGWSWKLLKDGKVVAGNIGYATRSSALNAAMK